MVRFRELQGNRDGYGFIHANPTQVVQRLTPGARDLLGHLRLLDYLTNLTNEMDMDLVIRARVSFDQERKSISIMGPGPDPIELFLSTRLLSQALGIPEGGSFIRKTEKMRDKCEPYFQGLVGRNKDGYPLEKIIDNDIRLAAQAISLFVELSRAERGRQIHARFFYGIVKHLEGEGPNDWVTPMLDELFKGFKSAKAFIAYGPQLTKIVRFALANPELYLRGHIPRPHPEPQEEQEVRPQEEPQQDPRAEEPNLEIPNLGNPIWYCLSLNPRILEFQN